MLLQEKRTIKTGKDAVELLNNGKLAGRLGGKKFIPSWIVEDPEMFEDLVDATILLMDDNSNTASDEVIQFLIKCCAEGPDKWASILESCKDTIIELSKAFATDWFKKDIWQEQLNALIEKPFNRKDWQNLEHEIQEFFSKRQAKKGKVVSNTSDLYDTLYDDGTWKLFTPKCFEGDVELASHIKPFKDGSRTYNKTRWCTAAGINSYRIYTKNGNKLYVIQYWENGVYTEAWQLAFNESDHIEFMDKTDSPHYDQVQEAPKELLEMIVADNPANKLLKDMNLAKIFEFGSNVREATKNLRNTAVRYNEAGYGINKIGEIVSFNKPLKEDLTISFINEAYSRDVKDIIINNEKVVPVKKLENVDNVKRVFIEGGIVPEGFFQAMKSLKEVTCGPNADIKILENNFNDCPVLETLNLKNAVFYKSFQNCPNIKNVEFSARIANNTGVFAETVEHLRIGCELISDDRYFQAPNLIELEILPTVKNIEIGAFENCENLVSVKFPKDAKVKVGAAAFLDCENLEFVENIESVEGNPKRIFAGCPKLKF